MKSDQSPGADPLSGSLSTTEAPRHRDDLSFQTSVPLCLGGEQHRADFFTLVPWVCADCTFCIDCAVCLFCSDCAVRIKCNIISTLSSIIPLDKDR